MEMSSFCWIATLICLSGTLINVKRINFCFYLWTIGDIMWVYYDLGQHLYSRTILDLVGLIIALWGVMENCIKPKKNKN